MPAIGLPPSAMNASDEDASLPILPKSRRRKQAHVVSNPFGQCSLTPVSDFKLEIDLILILFFWLPLTALPLQLYL